MGLAENGGRVPMWRKQEDETTAGVAGCCSSWPEPREFQKLLHGFIGGADEQAPQFLLRREE